MDYLFSPAAGCPPISEQFDLKGSWVDRHSSPGDRTLKDSDWPATRHLRLGAEAKAELLTQAGRGARFLCDCRCARAPSPPVPPPTLSSPMTRAHARTRTRTRNVRACAHAHAHNAHAHTRTRTCKSTGRA